MINPIFKFQKYNIPFQGRIYTTGHKNADLDSIASSVGVAHLANQIKAQQNDEYIPVTDREIDSETAYALAYFGIKPPEIKQDFTPTIKEIMKKQELSDVSIQKNSTIREFIDLIMKKDIKTAAVLNPDGSIAGVVSRKSLAEFSIRPVDYLKQLKEFDIPYETIVKLINAQVVVGQDCLQDLIRGDIQTGAYSVESLEELDLKEGIVIVGDRKDIQESAIKNGAKAIIVSRNSKIDQSVIELAKENNAIILSTELGVAKITSLLEQATPVSYIMNPSVASFDANKKVNKALNTVKNTKFGYFPVLEKGKFIGLIGREEIINPENNQIILVDHNNPSQFIPGIDKNFIKGVIDHHVQQLVLDSSRVPMYYAPVGATATLVAKSFKANGVEIPKEIAGILWSAIVSDTDNFTSGTTTDEDRKIASNLAKIAEIQDKEKLASELIRQRDAALEGLTAEELIKKDLKIFQVKPNVSYCVSQIKVHNSEDYVKNRQELEKALNDLDRENSTQGSALMITDSSKNATFLLVSDKFRVKARAALESNNQKFFDKKFNSNGTTYKIALMGLQNNKVICRLPYVQSRKEEVQPFVSQLFDLAI